MVTVCKIINKREILKQISDVREIIKYRNKDEKICITILFIAVIIVIIAILNLSIKGMIID